MTGNCSALDSPSAGSGMYVMGKGEAIGPGLALGITPGACTDTSLAEEPTMNGAHRKLLRHSTHDCAWLPWQWAQPMLLGGVTMPAPAAGRLRSHAYTAVTCWSVPLPCVCVVTLTARGYAGELTASAVRGMPASVVQLVHDDMPSHRHVVQLPVHAVGIDCVNAMVGLGSSGTVDVVVVSLSLLGHG